MGKLYFSRFLNLKIVQGPSREVAGRLLTTQCVLFPTVGSSDSGEGEDLVEDDEEGFSGGDVREIYKGKNTFTEREQK